jgi:hypothetical protein
MQQSMQHIMVQQQLIILLKVVGVIAGANV